MLNLYDHVGNENYIITTGISIIECQICDGRIQSSGDNFRPIRRIVLFNY